MVCQENNLEKNFAIHKNNQKQFLRVIEATFIFLSWILGVEAFSGLAQLIPSELRTLRGSCD